MEKTKCPYCDRIHSDIMALDDPDNEALMPVPGEFTICDRCGNLCLFDDDMNLVKLTDEEQLNLESQLSEEVVTLKTAIRNRYLNIV